MENYLLKSLFKLSGKKALVIGGTKGLGKEMAKCLIVNGCDVVIASRTSDNKEEIESCAEAVNSSVYFYNCDVLQTNQVIDLVTYSVNVLGRIDILINSAGRNITKMIENMDDDSWDAVLDLNLRANFIIMREVVKVMRNNGYGKIVNMSSMKSVFGVSDSGYTAYCASKGAINMLTKQVACEVAGDGITVNAIAPTFIETDINRHQLANEEFKRTLEDRIPVGRIGQFKDLMGLLLLLTSDASEFITGQIFLLDGGISARQ